MKNGSCDHRLMDNSLLELAKVGSAHAPVISKSAEANHEESYVVYSPGSGSQDTFHGGDRVESNECSDSTDSSGGLSPIQVEGLEALVKTRSLSSKRERLYGQDTPTLDVPSFFIDNAEEDFDPEASPYTFAERTPRFTRNKGSSARKAPSSRVVTGRLSKSGILHGPGFTVRHNGLSPCSDSVDGSSTTTSRQADGSTPTTSPTASHLFNSLELIPIGSLGKGSSGSVFKALHVSSLTVVAVKSVQIFDASQRRQVLAEIKALYQNLLPLSPHRESESQCDPAKSLDRSISLRRAEEESTTIDRCPYILGFYDAFVDQSDGSINMVLEWMDQGSLQDVINESGPLSVFQIARVLHCVLRGVKHLHERRILHRDIKPSNILMSSVTGLAKLSDFGISHDLGLKSQAMTFVGSLSYMAPERVRGGEAGYSYPADIWSIGLAIFVGITGRYPFQRAFEESGFWGVAHAVHDLPIPRVSDYATNDIPAELCDLVDRCLQRKPQDRPTAQELLEHPFLHNLFPFQAVMKQNKRFQEESLMDKGLMKDKEKRLDKLLELAASYHVSNSIKLQHTLPRFSREALESLMKQLGLPHDDGIVQAKLDKLRRIAHGLLRGSYSQARRKACHSRSRADSEELLESTM